MGRLMKKCLSEAALLNLHLLWFPTGDQPWIKIINTLAQCMCEHVHTRVLLRLHP